MQVNNGNERCFTVEQLGLEAIGSVSGNAEILANTIVKCEDDNVSCMFIYFQHSVFSGQEKSTLPLLFPCGNLAMDTVQTELEKAGLKLNRLVCYNTTREPHIEENLKALRNLQVSLFLVSCIYIHNTTAHVSHTRQEGIYMYTLLSPLQAHYVVKHQGIWVWQITSSLHISLFSHGYELSPFVR